MLGVVGAPAATVRAQQPEARPAQAAPEVRRDTLAPVPRAQATRAELEALLARKSDSLSPQEERLIRERLRNGDLQPGDRVALVVRGEQQLTDTFTVQPDRTLLLPNMEPIPVQGVLRSELPGYLRQQVSRYIKNPDLQAHALIRVGLFGEVGKPGFYNLPADALATDALMLAGGPSPRGDPNKSVIVRGSVTLATSQQVQQALQRGVSLDQLNIQSGDQIVVGSRSEGMAGALRTVGLITAPLFAIVALTRIF